MNSIFSQQRTRKVMSGLLAAWMSGFVFLFCCGPLEAQAKAEEFCPLAKAKSHCDKSNEKTDAPVFSGDSNSKFECCGFLPAVFDKVRKLEKNQQTAYVAEKIKIEKPEVSFVRKDFENVNFYRPPPLYEEKIFIKNCIFRI